jgi:hypothetical protein
LIEFFGTPGWSEIHRTHRDEYWKETSRICRRAMGLALGRKSGREEVGVAKHTTKNTAEMPESKDNETTPMRLLTPIDPNNIRDFQRGRKQPESNWQSWKQVSMKHLTDWRKDPRLCRMA